MIKENEKMIERIKEFEKINDDMIKTMMNFEKNDLKQKQELQEK